MKRIGSYRVCINAPFATRQCGHITQTQLIDTIHDPLYARLVYIHDGSHQFIHISMDLMAFPYPLFQQINELTKTIYGDNCILVTSTTHTHSGHDIYDQHYVEFLLSTLDQALHDLNEQIHDVTTMTFKVYQTHEDSIGRSRISGYESHNELLTVVDIHTDDWIEPSIRFIIYNCHPTVLAANIPYFSADFPGYVITQETKLHPSTFVSYINGACGDISTRFTRSGQDYASVMELGDKMVQTIESFHDPIIENDVVLSMDQTQIHYQHTFEPIDDALIPKGLTQREYQTIEYGQIMRSRLKDHPEKLVNTGQIETIDFNGFTIVFFSNEIFSAYMDYFDPTKALLVSYSNGYGPYILPLHFDHLTYESFLDTLTDQTKQTLIDHFRSINGRTTKGD